MTNIGERIKRARGLKKLSRRAFVAALEEKGLRLTERTVQNWETGFTEPRYSQIVIVREILSPFFELKEVENEDTENSTTPP